MDKKLTLSLNSQVIENAKKYARDRNISLSRMIENYLSALVKPEESEEEYSPTVTRLIGVIDLPEDYQLESDYADYLTEKYK